MRWVNRASAIVVATAIVVGPPTAVALWLMAQQWRFPKGVDARTWLEQPLTARTVVALISVIAAMVWLLLVCAIVHRAWKVALRVVRRRRRRPLPTPAQITAGSMAGVAALALPSVVVTQPDGAVTASSPSGSALSEGQVSNAQAGVDLPGGGWVPYRTAVAVTVLSSAIWLYRRQHYQPRRPSHDGHTHDLDLQPLPVTAETISARLDDQQPSESVPDAAQDSLPGLLVLSGPGAMNGARGLLVTTLLDSALASTPPATVIVRRRDLDFLLDGRRLGELPAGLSINETTPPEAVPGISADPGGCAETIVIVRNHPTARGSTGTADGSTTIVVVADDRPGRRSWHVATDGTATADGMHQTRRFSQLDRHAATDLLLLLQQHARTDPARVHPAAGSAVPAPARRPAEMRLLGGCRLLVHGTAAHVRRSAGLQVLAYLAVYPDGATTYDLIRAIWPGLNPNTITKRLHTTLTALRQQLHPMLGEVIIRQDERYRLDPAVIHTDLDTFRHEIREATIAVTDQQRQAAAHNLIVADHGELAAGFSWPWIHRPREALRRDAIDAYLNLASTMSGPQALELVRAATAADLYNEAVYHEAQRILQAAGEHEAAQALGRGLTQRLLTAQLHPGQTPTDHPSNTAYED